MDEPAEGVGRDYTEQPEPQENYEGGPEHDSLLLPN